MDDAARVAGVQQGSQEALADLFEDASGWLYSTCLNALRDADLAEEAAARTLEEVARTRLAGAVSLRSALTTLTYRAIVAVDAEQPPPAGGRTRREKPRTRPFDGDENLRLVVWRAADGLSVPDRALFVLAAAAGATPETVAAAVDRDRPYVALERLLAIRDHVVRDVIAVRSLVECDALRAMLGYGAREPDAGARKKVARHLEGTPGRPGCRTCRDTRDRWSLRALACQLPLTSLPPDVADRLLERMDAALPETVAAERAALAQVQTRHTVVLDGVLVTVPEQTRRGSSDGPAAPPSAPLRRNLRSAVGGLVRGARRR